ncbi:MAG TPA: glutamine--tRNA ligase [Elusimicrobia bacterium]|nr:MAG: glutamine--tRNA ligase [Elusimicrobia bacterium GWD2_63_28]HCC47119.1 glutamine--tRNA ligase [Elusimicrobiota bacterium]
MENTAPKTNFIREIIDKDMETGKFDGRVHTRFPPEPNGYLHIGHATSIILNSGIAAAYKGKFNLRFDDTNPAKEEQEYVDSIIEDVKWLGGDFEDRLFFASDYFQQMYDWAMQLVKAGKAFVCDLNADQIREHRGAPGTPGKDSPFRNRSIEENADLFERMKKGEFPDGSRTLRAKIDMAHPNINMRDPVMYRILHAEHHRQGNKWCIYPMYDWAHGLEDSIEGITHSICTLEFEDHRPLYDWYLDQLGIYHPQQIEFARRTLGNTITSKRKLLELVKEGHVEGWDDPRMPTVSGYRRRGYTASALRAFCDEIGITKVPGISDIWVLENALRGELNKTAPRAMAVLKPLKVVLTNYPEGQTEEMCAANNPEDEAAGTRKVPFTRELYIEQGDFMEVPPKKFFRMTPGQEVRLRAAYIVKCESVVKDAAGNISEVHCTYDPATRGGDAPDGRKIKGTIHWVSAKHAVPAKVRLYDALFTKRNPEDVEEGHDYKESINPASLEVIERAMLEPSLAQAAPGTRCQFERLGYFFADPKDSRPGAPVFNRTVTLKDTWAKLDQKAPPVK